MCYNEVYGTNTISILRIFIHGSNFQFTSRLATRRLMIQTRRMRRRRRRLMIDEEVDDSAQRRMFASFPNLVVTNPNKIVFSK